MKTILFGFVIGIANIIPGVSGGTFALILGIYPRMLTALGSYNAGFLKALMQWARTPRWATFRTLVLTRDFYFLAGLGIGALAAILSLSRVIKYCLEAHYAVTYGFFSGLILFSIPIPYRLLKRRTIAKALWLVVGATLTVWLSVQIDPSAKLLEKSRHYQLIAQGLQTSGMLGYSLSEYGMIFLVGMLAVSAMVLPGVSGSFVLLLFGSYYAVIAAVSRLGHLYPEDLLYLSVFSCGAVAGILLFVRLFNYLYVRFRDRTIFFLMGLMGGSLYALWPFKNVRLADLYVKTGEGITRVPAYPLRGNVPVLWESTGQLLWTLAAFVAGAAIMFGFDVYDRQRRGNGWR